MCVQTETTRGQAHLQLSKSRAVLTHSHARAPPPKTPQAAQPCPISEQEPLPIQRFLRVGLPEGHAPGATHLPLQTTLGEEQAQVVGFDAGEGVKPSMQVNPQGFPLTQAGTL